MNTLPATSSPTHTLRRWLILALIALGLAASAAATTAATHHVIPSTTNSGSSAETPANPLNIFWG